MAAVTATNEQPASKRQVGGTDLYNALLPGFQVWFSDWAHRYIKFICTRAQFK